MSLESLSLGFPTSLDTNWAVWPQKMVRGISFSDLERRGIVLSVKQKTNVLISCTVTVQLICAFVFVYATVRFSHEGAHMKVFYALYLKCQGYG